MQSRGNSDMYLLDLAANSEHLLTPHVGVALSNQAEFVDNDTLLISTNIDREFIALARVDIAADGTPGAVDHIAGRDDADLDSFELLAGGKVALVWNAAGRSELSYLDLANGEVTAGPQRPIDIAGRYGSLTGQDYTGPDLVGFSLTHQCLATGYRQRRVHANFSERP